MAIKSGSPAGRLSNFQPRPFAFDGVPCASMAGLLQAFKFEKAEVQRQVCQLVGRAAKFRGKKRNRRWRTLQMLWWQGTPYGRTSQEYRQLLDRAFAALAGNEKFCEALLSTGNAVLRHSLGKRKPSQTVLTEKEFVSRLMALRERLQAAAPSR